MISLIQERLDTLRRSERRVAEFTLEHLEEVLYLSVSELADRTGTSDPTVIRFCRSLGLRGYQEFKIELARQLVPRERTIHEAAEGGDDPASLVRRVFAANTDALAQTLQVLDPVEVGRAIDALAKAGRIEFYGMAASGVVALDAYHKFFRLGIPCAALTDPHMQAMSAALLQADDVAVAISHSGATKDIVESLRIAREAGAVTVAIIGRRVCPVAAVADIKLWCHTREQEFKPEAVASRIAQLSVIDALTVGVALRRKSIAVENLEKTRRALVNKRY
ncbi:MAG: MurR/RpiR family transcriptional regulator [Firmicutes bacterium]|jgi:DNA-binding MurR/RpiR family transcriptional regulator|nr:MurR/RpiR family transcriptional regulator [Bacillota bacterium]